MNTSAPVPFTPHDTVIMAVKPAEAAACLRVLVYFARSSGTLTANEKVVLEQEWNRLVLPPGTTLPDLLGEHIDLDKQLALIQTDEGRERTYNAAYLLANVDSQPTPQQQELLARMRKSLKLPEEKATPLGRIYWEAREMIFPTNTQPIADPGRRAAKINDEIMRYSLINAVSGAFPLPVLSIAADLLVISTQTIMVREVGRYWGHSVDRAAARSLMGTVLGGTGLRIAIHSLLNVVPVLGSAVGAASAFVSTYALGHAADKYFEANGKLDPQTLRNLYSVLSTDAFAAYEKSRDLIATRLKSRAVTLELLNEELESGRITREEYDHKIAGLQ